MRYGFHFTYSIMIRIPIPFRRALTPSTAHLFFQVAFVKSPETFTTPYLQP